MSKIKGSYAVLGLSTFGYQTAISLYQLGGKVIAVDIDDEIVQKIAPFVSEAICANVLERETLNKFNIPMVDVAIIGLRKTFDVCVLLIHYLRTETKIKKIIAYVDSPEKAEILGILGVEEVIFPEKDSADRLVKKLSTPHLLELFNISKDTTIIEINCPKEFVSHSIIDLAIRNTHEVSVIGIQRFVEDQYETIIAPPPNNIFEEHDKLILLGKKNNIDAFVEKFNNK